MSLNIPPHRREFPAARPAHLTPPRPFSPRSIPPARQRVNTSLPHLQRPTTPFPISLNLAGVTRPGADPRSPHDLILRLLDSQTRTSAPKLKLQINAAADVGPLFENYIGGLDPQPVSLAEEETILPESKTGVRDHWVTELETIRVLNSKFAEELSDDAFEVLYHLTEAGRVHKVRHTQSGMILARKTITTLEVPRTQLSRELNIAASADHPNIVKCFGVYMSPSCSDINILMEFCEGRSLDAVGKQHKELGAVVGEKIYGRLAEGILQGLDYLHRKKTIHRDIKPQNVLLSREGIVKLCDFSVSGELLSSYAGTFTGTSMYMAPERIAGADYTIRSDVWSTAITLLELVQGGNPYPPDLAPIELMMYITSGDPPQLEDGNGRHWSDEMKDFIKQMLNVDRHVRPTPKDMLQHVWVTTVMNQEVHMARWIRTVWGWPKSRHSKNRSVSSTNSTPSRSRDIQRLQ